MTSLHDELVVARSAAICKVCAFLSARPPDVADEWRQELALPISIIPHSSVVAALARRGVCLLYTSDAADE